VRSAPYSVFFHHACIERGQQGRCDAANLLLIHSFIYSFMHVFIRVVHHVAGWLAGWLGLAQPVCNASLDERVDRGFDGVLSAGHVDCESGRLGRDGGEVEECLGDVLALKPS
jgi:hypothetical protein